MSEPEYIPTPEELRAELEMRYCDQVIVDALLNVFRALGPLTRRQGVPVMVMALLSTLRRMPAEARFDVATLIALGLPEAASIYRYVCEECGVRLYPDPVDDGPPAYKRTPE